MTTEQIESSDGKSRWTMVRHTCTAAGCGKPSWVRPLPEHSVKYCPYCGGEARGRKAARGTA